MMHLRCIFHGNNNLIRMPLRKVFVDKEGDDDKKSINDALSWFLQKFTLIHFPWVELQLLLVIVASVIATSSVVSPVVSSIQTSALSTSSALLALSALSALLSSLPSLLSALPTAKVSRPS